MEFSTQTTASLHQIKTAALAVGVFADGVLSPAADLIDRAANGAVRAVAKTEFRGRAGATLTLRNLPGVTAQRVVLVGLGKQDEYSARAHAAAEQAFAQACVAAQLAEGVSTLVANPVADVPVIARARSAATPPAPPPITTTPASASPTATPVPSSRRSSRSSNGRMPPRPRRACAKAPPSPTACR